MITYIVRRLIWAVVLLLVISFLTFMIFYLLPSADPALLRAGRQPTPELIAAITEQLGLDKPWYEQYWIYLKGIIFDFDFGRSYINNVEVKEELFERLPPTISLAVGGAVVWLLAGVSVGIISAIKKGTIMDRLAMGAALLAISAPVYWLGLVSIYLFSTDLGKLVAVPFFNPNDAYVGPGEDLSRWFQKMILPWFVLATAFAAVYARFLRANLLDVMGEDYIRTARAKGLGERRVVFRHGVRSAITPVVTIFGLDLGILFGGAILTESVFNIPGVGRLAFDAIAKSDLPFVQGAVLIGATAIIIFNLIVDIIYAFIDPRVRY